MGKGSGYLNESLNKNQVSIAELFAGVGGFRLGLEGWKGRSALSGYKDSMNTSYKVIWSNQWEPSTKKQYASSVYESRFGNEGHCNEDITTLDISAIPDHDLLVAGFPCQDYSVASINAQGITGQKGILWWSIYKILKGKTIKPKFFCLKM
jgi:DNA (cytosine-5)-methyltransferase 1